MKLDGATRITESKPMTIDEVKRKLKLGGDKAARFEQSVLEKQDTQFSQLMSIIFGWKIQENGGKKLMSKMPNGKALFPDKSEDLSKLDAGIPYICLVYEPEHNPDGSPAKQAYAKIICEEDIPTIFIPKSRIPVMVWVDENGKKRNKVPKGNSYAERMMILLDIAEKKGWSYVKITFRMNQM